MTGVVGGRIVRCIIAVIFVSGTMLLSGGERANAANGFGFTRLGGVNRFATAGLLATAAYADGAPTAIVATGFNFPDALAANYLARYEQAPILLISPSPPIPVETLAALRALRTKHVILLGLRVAIAEEVRRELSATPSTAAQGGDLVVSRIGGQDRYDTMNLVDETPPATDVGLVDGKRTAIVTSGLNFADALAAGPLVYARSLPIVLTDSFRLSSQASQTLQDLGIEQVVIVGGPAAIGAGVELAINALGVQTLERVSGADRTETARLLGDFAIGHLSFDRKHFDLASVDEDFTGADGLALGPLAALQGARTIQFLRSATQTGTGAPQFVRDNLAALSADNLNTLAGGSVPAPDDVVVPLIDAYNAGAGVTALPELLSARVLATTTPPQATPIRPAGTLVSFVFDEALDAASAKFDAFELYDSDLPNSPFSGASGAVDQREPSTVDVNFPSVSGGAELRNLSVAAVKANAVSDLEGSGSPAGAVALGVAHTLSGGPGMTQAPDAESSGGFRPASLSQHTAIDISFDAPAFSQLPDRDNDHFSIVYSDQHGSAQQALCEAPGNGNTSVSGGTSVGGNGSTVLTVVCPDDPSTPSTTLQPGQVGRIVIQPGAVGTDYPARSPVVASFLQSVDGPEGVTPSPDLSSALLEPSASFGGLDQILVTMDQPVFSTTAVGSATSIDPTKFLAVLADGQAVEASSAVPANGNPTQLLVSFSSGVDAEAVGIEMLMGAVSGTAAGFYSNADDEIATANSGSVTATPGETDGPALRSVVLSAITDRSGKTVGESAQLTFSQDLGGPSAPPLNALHAYDGDGTELTCAPPAQGGGSNGLDISDDPFPNGRAPATLQCDNWALGVTATGSQATVNDMQTIVLITVDGGMVANRESQYNAGQAFRPTGGTGVPQQG